MAQVHSGICELGLLHVVRNLFRYCEARWAGNHPGSTTGMDPLLLGGQIHSFWHTGSACWVQWCGTRHLGSCTYDQITHISATMPQITSHLNVCATACSANNKENAINPHHWPFMKEIYMWQVDSTHKGPIMLRKGFLCRDVFMTRLFRCPWPSFTNMV